MCEKQLLLNGVTLNRFSFLLFCSSVYSEHVLFAHIFKKLNFKIEGLIRMGGGVAGTQDKKVAHKCATQENVGRLARGQMQHDEPILPSCHFKLF